jgi:apolipoprotein N-acyltransferase
MSNEPENTRGHVLSLVQQGLLAGLSGLLLSLAFLDEEYYLFAWVAYVPFLWAINGVGLLRAYGLGLMSGLAFCVSAGYWIVDFLMLSKSYELSASIVWAILFWLYCANLSALVAVAFSWLRRRTRVHEIILFPLVIVTAYSAFPMLFTVRLGESQTQFLSAIQASDITGVHGVDAVIALCNIILFRLSVLPVTSQKTKSIRQCALASVTVAAWFVYGLYSTQSWELNHNQSNSIRIGIVQPNEVPSLESAKVYPGYSRAYPPEIEMSERLALAGAELVIWPEAKYKGYLDHSNIRKAYQAQLRELGASLIFQDVEHVAASMQSSFPLRYNTALMLNSEGSSLGEYQKMKRIPFGEYVPLASDIPVLRKWVEGFFGKFLNEMAEGPSHQVFSDKRFNVIPLICYEVMYPGFVAEAVAVSHSVTSADKKEKLSLLVGLSSNGWFGVTRQPYQHVNASILRAVENRMPLVHAVNNGPSIVAMPSGKVIFMSGYHQAGGYIVDLPFNHEVTPSFYSKYPKLFLYSVYSVIILLLFRSLGSIKIVFKHS